MIHYKRKQLEPEKNFKRNVWSSFFVFSQKGNKSLHIDMRINTEQKEKK